MLSQRCPRCNSSRIQHGYNDSPEFLRLVGIHELLCNNCNLEFKGLAPLGKKRERSTKDEFINRRRTPRFTVRLPVSVAQIKKSPVSKEVRYSAVLKGHTHVISQLGLTLVLPSTHIGSHDFTDTGHSLRVKLALPTGIIVMHVSSTNHHKLDDKSADRGWVIGTRIIKTDIGDRLRYLEYLKTLG